MEPIPRDHALVVKHELQAESWSLNSPDFATPSLAVQQLYKLAPATSGERLHRHCFEVKDFSLGSPTFGPPECVDIPKQDPTPDEPLECVDIPKQDPTPEQQRRPPGRPRAIPKDKKDMLIALVADQLREEQAKACHQLVATDQKVIDLARGVANHAGIYCSDDKLRREIISPALKRIRPPKL